MGGIDEGGCSGAVARSYSAHGRISRDSDTHAEVRVDPTPAGGGQRRVRIIDDVRASAVNDTLGMSDTAVPDCLDVFYALVSYFGLIRTGRILQAASVDFSHAYKNLGIGPGQDALPRC